MFAENYSGMAFFRDFHIRRNTGSHQAIALHPRKCSSVSVVQCQLEYRVEWEIQAVFVSVTSLFSLCLLSLSLSFYRRYPLWILFRQLISPVGRGQNFATGVMVYQGLSPCQAVSVAGEVHQFVGGFYSSQY